MAGILIKIADTSVSFKGTGLRSVYAWENHIIAANLEDQTAFHPIIKTYHEDMKAANLVPKFKNGIVRLCGFGTPRADSINAANPGLGSLYRQAEYIGDNVAYHTRNGWGPNGLSYARSGLYVDSTKLSLPNLHFHAHLTGAEESGGSVQRFLAGLFHNAPGVDDLNCFFQANGGGASRANIGTYSTSGNVFGGGSSGTQTLGYRSAYRVGTNLVYTIGAGLIASITKSDTMVANATTEFIEGGTTGGLTTNITKSVIRCLAIGDGTWTAEDDLNHKAILDKANTAILLIA